MTKVRLFGSRLSPFVEKVARALALKKVEFELVEPTSPTDFRKWSPQTAKMPVLEIDGDRVDDSTFILRRLDEDFAEPPLYVAARPPPTRPGPEPPRIAARSSPRPCDTTRAPGPGRAERPDPSRTGFPG